MLGAKLHERRVPYIVVTVTSSACILLLFTVAFAFVADDGVGWVQFILTDLSKAATLGAPYLAVVLLPLIIVAALALSARKALKVYVDIKTKIDKVTGAATQTDCGPPKVDPYGEE